MPKRKSDYASDNHFIVSDDRNDNDAETSASVSRSKRSKTTITSPHCTTASSRSSIQRDTDNNPYWGISKARRVTLSDFKGNKMVSIREYYEKDGTWLPGKKGISLTLEQWNALVGVLPGIERELKRGGVDDLVRPVYSDNDGDGAVKEEEGDGGEAVNGQEEVGEDNEDSARGGRANHEATSDEE